MKSIALIFITFDFVRRFLWRWDRYLAMVLVLVALQTILQLASLALIVGGLRSAVSGSEIHFMGITFSMFPTAGYAIAAGIVGLGIAAGLEILALVISVATASRFGGSVINAILSGWDELSGKQRKYVFKLAGLTTTLCRQALRSLTPLAMFAAGLVVLLWIEPLFALAVLFVGIVALFSFLPTRFIESRREKLTFDADVDARTIRQQRPFIRKVLRQKMMPYFGRRLIRSVNLVVFFLALALVGATVNLGWAVDRFAEAIVVVMLVARVSISSLSRVSLMINIVGKNVPAVKEIYHVLDTGTLSAGSENMDIRVDDDEEDETSI